MPDPSTCPPGSRPVESWCWVMVRGEEEGRWTARHSFHRHCAWCGLWLLWPAVACAASCTRHALRRYGTHAVPDGAPLSPCNLRNPPLRPASLSQLPTLSLPPHRTSMASPSATATRASPKFSSTCRPRTTPSAWAPSSSCPHPRCALAPSLHALLPAAARGLRVEECLHCPGLLGMYRLHCLRPRGEQLASTAHTSAAASSPAQRCGPHAGTPGLATTQTLPPLPPHFRCSTRCGAPSPTSSTPSPSRRWAVVKACMHIFGMLWPFSVDWASGHCIDSLAQHMAGARPACGWCGTLHPAGY